MDVRVLSEWYGRISERIVGRIKILRTKKLQHWNKKVLDCANLEYLDEFHQRYVLVPADKAGNNIIVVCKKCYVEVVVELLNNDQPSTYVEVDYNHMQRVNTHVNDLEYRYCTRHETTTDSSLVT